MSPFASDNPHAGMRFGLPEPDYPLFFPSRGEGIRTVPVSLPRTTPETPTHKRPSGGMSNRFSTLLSSSLASSAKPVRQTEKKSGLSKASSVKSAGLLQTTTSRHIRGSTTERKNEGWDSDREPAMSAAPWLPHLPPWFPLILTTTDLDDQHPVYAFLSAHGPNGGQHAGGWLESDFGRGREMKGRHDSIVTLAAARTRPPVGACAMEHGAKSFGIM